MPVEISSGVMVAGSSSSGLSMRGNACTPCLERRMVCSPGCGALPRIFSTWTWRTIELRLTR